MEMTFIARFLREHFAQLSSDQIRSHMKATLDMEHKLSIKINKNQNLFAASILVGDLHREIYRVSLRQNVGSRFRDN